MALAGQSENRRCRMAPGRFNPPSGIAVPWRVPGGHRRPVRRFPRGSRDRTDIAGAGFVSPQRQSLYARPKRLVSRRVPGFMTGTEKRRGGTGCPAAAHPTTGR